MRRYGNGYINKGGYRLIRKEGRYVLEHRWIIEQEIGRRLQRHEHIHHLNGNRLDNRRENLQLIDGSLHSAHHATEIWKHPSHRAKLFRYAKRCQECRRSFVGNSQQKYCSRRCKNRLVMRAFYHRHRTRLRRQHDEWYRKNREKQLVYSRAYYQTHASSCRAFARAYYARHRRERQAYSRRYQHLHRDRLKLYYKRRYQLRKGMMAEPG